MYPSVYWAEERAWERLKTWIADRDTLIKKIERLSGNNLKINPTPPNVPGKVLDTFKGMSIEQLEHINKIAHAELKEVVSSEL